MKRKVPAITVELRYWQMLSLQYQRRVLSTTTDRLYSQACKALVEAERNYYNLGSLTPDQLVLLLGHALKYSALTDYHCYLVCKYSAQYKADLSQIINPRKLYGIQVQVREFCRRTQREYPLNNQISIQ